MITFRTRCALTSLLLALSVAAAFGQIKVFDPVDVNPSKPGTCTETQPCPPGVSYATATLRLNCPSATPITAVLSSSADGTKNLLADNFIRVTSPNATSPGVNVCVAGDPTGMSSQGGTNCFQIIYEGEVGGYLKQNPDTATCTAGGCPANTHDAFLQRYGVAPIDLQATPDGGTHSSPLLVAGSQDVKFEIMDWGGDLGNTSIFLTTNCTQAGVEPGATITGNPIDPNDPTTLTQTFTFDSVNGQNIVLTADWTRFTHLDANTVPTVTNNGIAPSAWPTYVTGSSFATTQCLPYSGELDANGNPLCKAYTLTCTSSASSTPSGSNCPTSDLRNLLFTSKFDVPPAYANLLTIPNKNNNLGFGFLMGSDNWAPGQCTLTAPELGFLCPQNLATSFHDILSGGTTKGTNSTFVIVSGVPLPSTTVNGQGNGGTIWTNTSATSIPLTFSTSVPAASGNNFAAAPIASVTYGLDSGPPYPDTTFPIPGDQPASPSYTPDSTQCHTAPGTAPFASTAALAGPLSAGQHTLHFFATDCAATEELVYDTSNLANTNNWVSFKTVTINVLPPWSGFLQPVDNPPALNSVKAGSAIPVKFSLGGNFGLNIFAGGYPQSATAACDASAPVDAIESTVTAGASSLQYDATTQTYTYVWKTDSKWSGMCRQLVLKFADGTTQFANFKFK